MYGIGGKSNASSVYSTPSCCNVAFEPASASATDSTTVSPATTDIPMGGPPRFMGGPTDSSSASGAPLLTDTPPSPMRTNTHPSTDPKGVNTVYLPKTVLALLKNPPAPTPVRSLAPVSTTSLLVADSGAAARTAEGLWRRHGEQAFEIIQLGDTQEVFEGLGICYAELQWIAQHEDVLTREDLLRRRLPIAMARSASEIANNQKLEALLVDVGL